MKMDHLALYLSHEQILERIDKLAAQLNEEYKGKDVIFVCLLTGGFMFFSDLIKKITINARIDFIETSSYIDNKKTDTINMTKNFKYNPSGAHIVLFDDIIDTGSTIDYILNFLKPKNPASVRVYCVLIKELKKDFQHLNEFCKGLFQADESLYYVGYGMDDKEYYRQLNGIYYIKK